MADTSMTIDDADERETLNGAEYLPSSYGGEPYKISTESIHDLVIAKLEQMSASGSSLGESDCVFATIEGGFHKPTVAVVVQSVYSILMGKAAASSLTDTTVISVDQPVTASGVTTHVPKTTTLAALAAYVAAEIGAPTFDVHALTSTTTPLSDADETPLAQGVQQGGTTVWSTLKTSLSALATYVIGKLRSVAVESTVAIDPDDEMMIFDKSQYHVFKRAKFSALGIGAGNVTAPAAHEAGTIPAWNGSTSDDPPDNSLTAGYNVVTSIGAAPTNTQLPTAAAVSGMTAFKTTAPTTTNPVTQVKSLKNTNNNIPQWDGTNSGTLKDGLVLASAMIGQGEGASIDDDHVPTTAAVSDFLYNRSLGVVCDIESTPDEDGIVTVFKGTSGTRIKSSGKKIANSNTSVSSGNENLFIPTVGYLETFRLAHTKILTFNTESDLTGNTGDLAIVHDYPQRLYFKSAVGWYYATGQSVP